MDFDFPDRKPLLYADLFKTHKNSVVVEQNNNNIHTIMSRSELGSSSSLSSNPSSFCDSSSSGFSTPFDYELGSSESDDGDFMAELTRQMAEGMLLEEEPVEENVTSNSVFEDSQEITGKKHSNQRYKNSSTINNLKNGSYPNPISTDDQTPTLQVNQLKNQPLVDKQSASVSRERRFKGTASIQQKQRYVQYRGRDWGMGHGLKGQTGSGMQAVFLGGSGSKSGSTGTGVFLPRVNNNPTELKKKSGCATVLIPTRVLQALEDHFNRRLDSLAPPIIGGSPNHSSPSKDASTRSIEQQNGQSRLKDWPTNHEEEMKLPQEWTY